MKAVRIELMNPDHHALRVAAAQANQTMRQFAQEVLLRAVRPADPAGSGPDPAPDRSGQADASVGQQSRERA